MAKESIFSNSGLRNSFLGSGFEELFESEEEMVGGIFGLLDFVNHYFHKDKTKQGDIFLLKLKVVFTNKVKEVEIDTGMFEDTLIINAPMLGREKKVDKDKRRMELLNNFLQSVQDSKLKTIIFLYTTLSQKSRKQLVSSFLKKKKRLR